MNKWFKDHSFPVFIGVHVFQLVVGIGIFVIARLLQVFSAYSMISFSYIFIVANLEDLSTLRIL